MYSTPMDDAITILPPDPVTALTPSERVTLARQIHDELVETSERLAEAWFQLGALLSPVKELELWREIEHDLPDGRRQAFASFTDYVDVVVRQPVTTINNYVRAIDACRDAGLDPETLKDIRLSRVEAIAKVAKAYDGHPPAEIIEPLIGDARRAETRPEARAFLADVSKALSAVGAEVDEWLRLKGDLSAIEMIRQTIAAKREQLTNAGIGSITDAVALEIICLEWQQTALGFTANTTDTSPTHHEQGTPDVTI